MMTGRTEVDVPASTATARTTPTEKIRTPDWHGRYTALRFGIYLQDHTTHTGGLNLRDRSHNTVSLTTGRTIYLQSAVGDVVVWRLRTTAGTEACSGSPAGSTRRQVWRSYRGTSGDGPADIPGGGLSPTATESLASRPWDWTTPTTAATPTT
jgi:hypothetical protein